MAIMHGLFVSWVTITIAGLSQLGATAPTEIVLLEERGATDTWGDHTGFTSQHSDGEGNYIETDDVHYYASGVKCWTDVFSVNNEIDVEDWVRQAPEADCTSTSVCISPQLGTTQKCDTSSFTNVPAFNAGATAKFAAPFVGEVEAAVGGGYQAWIANGQSTCTTVDVTFQCQWNDGQCHSLWLSDVVVKYNGYIRRRCNFNDGKGDQTVWSWDTSVTTPTNLTRLGCAATCDMQSYPSPVPGFTDASPQNLIVY
ncbi:hypothetical protein B0T10DRAFT_499733 [Thelonectria olida]|uniref:Uncharacterized protein n=1 Tax=Thelonectria olida TaxID=1576542 RepID=A0A9P8VUM0_9HYPO|nr:hypothetical protein B0T10DRAFT_499733 [Thelonectria olida]